MRDWALLRDIDIQDSLWSLCVCGLFGIFSSKIARVNMAELGNKRADGEAWMPALHLVGK